VLNRATLLRLAEAFLAVFVVTLAADPLFSGAGLDLAHADGLKALASAVVAAGLLAARRVLATR
jgi:hypothetical protein